MRVFVALAILIACTIPSLSFDSPYSQRRFLALDRKIEAGLEDIGACSRGSAVGDLMFCSVYYHSLATGYYHRGDYGQADRFVRLADANMQKLGLGRPCLWFNQRFDNDEYGIHADIIFAQPQASFEVFLKSNPGAAQNVGLKAHICEALQTYGYTDGKMWSNIASQRLDKQAFIAFAKGVYGEAGAAQVQTFLSEIVAPLSGPAKQVFAGYNSASAREKVTIVANAAELYRNAAEHSRTVGLDRTFTQILQETADHYDQETVNWSKLAQ